MMASKPPRIPISRSAGASPAQQSTLQAFLPPPPSPSSQTLSLKELQEALRSQTKEMEATLDKRMADMLEKNKEIREDFFMALKGIAYHIEEIEETIEKLTQSNTQLEVKMTETQNKMDRIETELLTLQYKEMEYALRVRGLKEDPQEDLIKLFADAFAPLLHWQPVEVERIFERVYRVNSWVARQKKLPRDVVVYFYKKSLRNIIIEESYNNKFQVGDQDVLVLKEIPPKMLKSRREFAFLTDELKKKQLQFRWDVPTGLVLNYLGTRYRLTTVEKAKEFYYNVLKVDSLSSLEKKSGQVAKQMEDKMEQQKDEIPLAKKDLDPVMVEDQPSTRRVTRAAARREARRRQEQQNGSKIQEPPRVERAEGESSSSFSSMDMEEIFQKLKGGRK
jgi:uncharacterized protein YoxC